MQRSPEDEQKGLAVHLWAKYQAIVNKHENKQVGYIN